MNLRFGIKQRVLPLILVTGVLGAPLMGSSRIEVIRLEKAPYNETAIIKRMYSEDSLIGGATKNPLILQVGDFPVGVNYASKLEWLKGMRENANGSAVLLWLYGPSGFQKRYYLSKDDATSFVEDRTYFKDRFRKYFNPEDLTGLKPGKVAVTAILVNSYGESLKTDRANRSMVLNYLTKSDDDSNLQKGLNGPRVIYNEPYGNFQEGQPIMLDFYLLHADLGSDAYKVELYIDGQKQDTLTDWNPYKIRNLSKGVHEIRLILIDPSGNPVPELLGEQKEKILVGK